VAIQPIRLFGDPVLRAPRRSRSSTSTASCVARSGSLRSWLRTRRSAA